LETIFEKPFLPPSYHNGNILIQLVIHGPQPAGLGDPNLHSNLIWVFSPILEMNHSEVPHGYGGEDYSAQIHVQYGLCEEQVLLLGDELVSLGLQKGFEEDLREELEHIACEEKRAKVLR
jgi:hypothetical protein